MLMPKYSSVVPPTKIKYIAEKIQIAHKIKAKRLIFIAIEKPKYGDLKILRGDEMFWMSE